LAVAVIAMRVRRVMVKVRAKHASRRATTVHAAKAVAMLRVIPHRMAPSHSRTVVLHVVAALRVKALLARAVPVATVSVLPADFANADQ
jgi:uncharacterized protein (UPF0147 family)